MQPEEDIAIQVKDGILYGLKEGFKFWWNVLEPYIVIFIIVVIILILLRGIMRSTKNVSNKK